MIHLYKSFLFVLLVVGLLATGPSAQDVPLRSDRDGSGDLVIEVDQAQFLSGDSVPYRLEIFYKIYNAGFEFTQRDDIWVANYDLMIAVYDDDGVQQGRFEKQQEIRVATAKQTRSLTDYRTSLAAFSLPEGKYKVNVYLSDPESDRVGTLEYETELRDLVRGAPTMSDILFAYSAGSQGERPHVFDRGNLLVVPSVSRTYGSTSSDRLLFYMEIYQGESDDDDVVVETKIRRGGNKMVYRDTLTAHFDEPVQRQLREISLAEYLPGTYDIEIRLRGRRFKELDERIAEFRIVWDQQALIKHDFKTALSQLKYIARGDELKPLEEATTPEEREKAYERTRSDPGDAGERSKTGVLPARGLRQQYVHRHAARRVED